MILCATDFSPGAEAATTIAARLANRLGVPLHLLHALDAGAMPVEVDEALLTKVRARLGRDAERLRHHGGTVTEQLVEGTPDERIVEAAESLNPRLVVVGAYGFRSPRRWLIGSVAERIVQTCPLPVLAVRWRDQLDAWARGSGPLRVLIGHDGTGSDDPLLGWVELLRRIGPCDLVLGHVFLSPPQRDTVHAVRPAEPRSDVEVAQLIAADLKTRWQRLGAGSPPSVRAEPGIGMIAHHLADLAERERADLVVVGTHRRQGLDRLWHGSVANGVLRLAGVSVACVPRE